MILCRGDPTPPLLPLPSAVSSYLGADELDVLPVARLQQQGPALARPPPARGPSSRGGRGVGGELPRQSKLDVHAGAQPACRWLLRSRGVLEKQGGALHAVWGRGLGSGPVTCAHLMAPKRRLSLATTVPPVLRRLAPSLVGIVMVYSCTAMRPDRAARNS